MSGYLDPMQVDALLRPLNPNRVLKKDGMSHLVAYDVRRWLITVFGFGRWSEETTDLVMLYEQQKPGTEKDPRWRAAYRATVRLTIHAPDGTPLAVYTESAVGTNWGFLPDTKRDEAHDMAIKTAASQALKRCATNLGDGGGLSLYNKGATGPLVRFVLGPDPVRLAEDGTFERPEKDAKVDTSDAHIDSQLAPEDTPQAPASAPTSPPAAQEQAPMLPVDDEAPLVEDNIRNRVFNVIEGGDATTPAGKKAALMRLLMEANNNNVKGAMVAGRDGEALTLEALITRELAAVKRVRDDLP